VIRGRALVVLVSAAAVLTTGTARALVEPSMEAAGGGLGGPVRPGLPYTCVIAVEPERALLGLDVERIDFPGLPAGVRLLDAVSVTGPRDAYSNGCLLGGDIREEPAAATAPLGATRLSEGKTAVLAFVLVFDRPGRYQFGNPRIHWQRGLFQGSFTYGVDMDLYTSTDPRFGETYYGPD
jgi:hypothetical protein